MHRSTSSALAPPLSCWLVPSMAYTETEARHELPTAPSDARYVAARRHRRAAGKGYGKG